MTLKQKELIETSKTAPINKIIKETNKESFRDNEILLSNVVMDQAEAFKFELLYVPGFRYVLSWKANTPKGKEEKEEFSLMLFEPLKVYNVISKLLNKDLLTEHNDLLIEQVVIKRFIEIIEQVFKIGEYVPEDLEPEVKEIIAKLFKSLVNVGYYDEEDHIQTTTNNLMIEVIEQAKEELKSNNRTETQIKLIDNLYNNKDIGKTRRILGRYLNSEHRIIIRNEINTYYKLDKNLLGFNKVSFDDIRRIIRDDLGNNIVSTEDLEKALSVIDEIKKPVYNKVKFNNCIYDMELMEEIHPEKPVFTLTESKYNYNPYAESKYLKEFLETSLNKGTPERTKEYIKGLLQLVGYSFVSGNPLTALIFIVGVGGGGKSVFTNILTEIYGVENIADLSLQDLDRPHGTSSLIDKQLNIVRDADDRTVEAEDTLKQLSGNDPIDVEPKFKNKFTIKRQEVPKTFVIANAIPKFRKTSQSLLSRFVLVEFNVKFRGTNKEDKHLMDKIISEPQEIEWLIYNGLEAYKDMLKNNQDFILRLNEKETKQVVEKYTKPVNYLISKLILKYDPLASETEPLIYADKLNKLCVKLAKLEGIEVKTNKNDLIDGRALINAIREEFNLFDVVDSYGNNYNSDIIKVNGKPKRFYPDLIKDVDMWEQLEHME